MQKTLTNSHFPNLKRVRQVTSSHCGPAVLEMLLSFLGVETEQEKIVEVTEVAHKIYIKGMTISELALAINKLFPDLTLWYKTDASLSDLSRLVSTFEYPVGVEWQGIFEDEKNGISEYTDEGALDDDEGHYSVITHIDTGNNVIMMADPYGRYAGIDRRFSIDTFLHRWWDENDGIETYHAMFVITPKSETFPESLGMIKSV